MATGTEVKLELIVQTIDRAKSELDSISRSLNKLTRNTGKASKAMQTLQQNALKLVAVGTTLSAIAFFPVKTAASFEKSMSRVRAVTEGATAQFAELNKTASDLGGRTEFTAKQVADGMTFLGLAGFNASEVMRVMADTVDLAAAGNIDLSRAADISTNILKGFQLQVEDTSRVLDVMATTATNSNTNINQLGEAMKFAAPVATAAGLSIEQTAAAVGILSNNGIQATLAGTGMRIILASLLSPAKKARDALKRLNVEIAFNEDGSLNLVTTLKRLRDANLSAADAFAIFQRRGASSALALVNQIDEFENLTEKNEDAKGSLTEMAGIMRDNLEFATVKLTSALDKLARAFGEPLLAPLKKVALFFADLADRVADFIIDHPMVAKVVLGTIAALGALLLGLGGIGLATSAVTAIWAVAAAGVAAFGGAIAAAVAFIAPAIPIILAVAGVVGLLTVAWDIWGKSSDEVTKKVVKTNSEIKKLDKDAQLTTKTFNKLSTNVEKTQEALDKSEKGTEKYRQSQEDLKDESAKLVVELEKVITNNFDLAASANIAKGSIDTLNGGFHDGGKALRDFKFDQQVDALGKFREGLKVTAKELNTFAQKNLQEVFENVETQIGDIRFKISIKPLDPNDTKALKSVKAQFDNLIKQSKTAGLISFDTPIEGIRTMGESMGIAGFALDILVDRFTRLQEKATIAASSTEKSIKTELDKRQQIQVVIIENIQALEGLKKANDDANAAAVKGAPKTLTQQAEITRSEKELAEAVKATTDEFQRRNVLDLEELRNELKEAEQAEDAFHEKGIKSKKEAENAKLRLRKDSLQKQALLLENTLSQIRQLDTLGVIDIDQFQKSFEKSLADFEVTAKEEAITFERIQNDALKKVDGVYTSTFKKIGNTIRTELGKSEKAQEKFNKKIQKLNKSAIDDAKEGAKILKGLEEAAGVKTKLDKENQALKDRLKLVNEIEQVVATVGNITGLVKSGDTKRVEKLKSDLKALRDETIRINKVSKSQISDTKNIQNVKLLNNLIDITNRKEQEGIKLKEDQTDKIEELKTKLKEVADASKIKLTLTNLPETQATIEALAESLKAIGVEVDESKLIELRKKVIDAFKNVPDTEIGVGVDNTKLNQDLKQTKTFVVQFANNEFKDFQVPLDIVPAFEQEFGRTIPGIAKAITFIKQAGKDLQESVQDTITSIPLTAEVQAKIDPLLLQKELTKELVQLGTIDLRVGQESLKQINEEIADITKTEVIIEPSIDLDAGINKAIVEATGGVEDTGFKIDTKLNVSQVDLDNVILKLEETIPSTRTIDIKPVVREGAAIQAGANLQAQFDAAGQQIEVKIGARPSEEAPINFIQALTGVTKELPVSVPVQPTEESPKDIKDKIQAGINTAPLIGIKTEPDTDALLQTRKKIVAILGKPITVVIRTVQAKSAGGIVNAFKTGGLVFNSLVSKFADGGSAFANNVRGKLSGFGGGDKVKAMLEKGEFIMKKEAVRGYGENFMNAINQMKLGFGGVQKFQTGGAVGGTTKLNLRINGSKTVQLRGADNDIKRLTKILRRERLVTN